MCLKLSLAEDALVAQSCETFDLVGYTKASLPSRDAQLRLVTAGAQKRDVFVGSISGSTVAIEPSGTKKFLGYAEPLAFGVATVRRPPAQYGGVPGLSQRLKPLSCYPQGIQRPRRWTVASSVRAVVNSTNWRRLALALFAVPALLLGFIAMHAVSSETAPSADAHLVVEALVAVPLTDSAGTDSAVQGSCDQQCGVLHDITTVACAFALVATALFLVPVLASRYGFVLQRLSRPNVLAYIDFPARQPSLKLLSISRI